MKSIAICLLWLLAGLLLGACAPAGFSTAGPPPVEQLPVELPPSSKGYELYSWRDRQGAWRFTLVTGTNRQKSASEITAAGTQAPVDGWVQITAVDTVALVDLLGRLPAGTPLFWIVWDQSGGNDFPLPPADVVAQVESEARRLGLSLSIVRGDGAGRSRE